VDKFIAAMGGQATGGDGGQGETGAGQVPGREAVGVRAGGDPAVGLRLDLAGGFKLVRPQRELMGDEELGGRPASTRSSRNEAGSRPEHQARAAMTRSPSR